MVVTGLQRRLILATVLGAITTLAVAWLLAMQVVVPLWTSAYVTGRGLYADASGQSWCQIKRRPGLTVVVWEPVVVQTVTVGGPGEESQLTVMARVGNGQSVVHRLSPDSDVPYVDRGAVPSWALRARGTNTITPVTFNAASARGWPMRAMWYEVRIAGGGRLNSGGADVPPDLAWFGPGPVLPLRVLPLGFAADTALYAAAWLVVLGAIGRARRRAQRHLGRCPDCGYDLAHADHDRCPECGSWSAVL